MNNAFHRLKHYRVIDGRPDSRENHATECLAACLVFSTEILRKFLNFLETDKSGIESLPDPIDISTQVQLDTGGWIDLVLRAPGVATIALEAKVGARESDPHHLKQLEEYRKWLDRQKGKGYLFTLVRDQDANFQQAWGAKRRTWRQLHASFSSQKWRSDISHNIISQFCDYLEMELIVTNWKTTDLQFLSSGMRAQRALRAIFASLEEYVQVELKLETKLVPTDDEWWRLEIGGGHWDSVFGKGYNNKLWVWYRVAPAWGITESDEGFCPELVLWHKAHGNEWESTKKPLKAWIQACIKAGLVVSVADTWRSEDRKISSLAQVGDMPAMIRAKRTSDEILAIDAQKLTQEELVRKLWKTVRPFDSLVVSLGAST